MIFRILLILVSLTILFYFLVKVRKKPTQKIGISLVFGAIILFASYPELANTIAHYFGIGRGVDFVFYLSFLTLFFFAFNLYLGLRESHEQITLLTRAFAITQSRIPDLTQWELGVKHDLSDDLIENTYVIIPAYYEGEVIESVVNQVLSSFKKVIVIDDGSRDQTFVNALKTKAFVLKHQVNLGQGASLQTGFEFALTQNAKYIITFDADGQHRQEDAILMLQRLVEEQQKGKNTKIALGSRFLGAVIDMPRSRKFILKLAIKFTQFFSNIELTDTHNGLRVIDCTVIPLLRITQNRMAHASEILHAIQENQISFIELPVTIAYTERSLKKGQSALNAINIVFDLLIKRLFGT